MKKLLLTLSLIVGTATPILVMQQKPSQAKAYNEYEPNYLYISNYQIDNVVATDPLLHIEFTGTFNYFKEKPVFYSYTEKNVIYELNERHELSSHDYSYMDFQLIRLTEVDTNKTEEYENYYELFHDTKFNDNSDNTLTVITNNVASKITKWLPSTKYELVIHTFCEMTNQEVINDIVRQTLKNLKIANSKYAQDKIATFGMSEDYLYKQGYNQGYYVGQLNADKDTYKNGYDEGYKKGWDKGKIRGQEEGFEEAYNKGYNEAMENLDTEYANGYKEGYEKAIKDANVLPNTIFTTIGSVAGFIGQLGEVEILGISLLDVLAMITIVGVVILITKVAL